MKHKKPDPLVYSTRYFGFYSPTIKIFLCKFFFDFVGLFFRLQNAFITGIHKGTILTTMLNFPYVMSDPAAIRSALLGQSGIYKINRTGTTALKFAPIFQRGYATSANNPDNDNSATTVEVPKKYPFSEVKIHKHLFVGKSGIYIIRLAGTNTIRSLL